jgi:ABC-type phosphate/phosphonate transport system substrate-binding protein
VHAGYYCSALVVRADDSRTQLADFAAATLAYNEPLSQSGWAAPFAQAAQAGFAFTSAVQTGSHVASARAVADGRADIAALDILTWRMIQRFDAFAEGLRVLCHTDPTPGLPYITAARDRADALFEAVADALDTLGPETRGKLGFRGLTRIAPEAYLAVPTPPAPPA